MLVLVTVRRYTVQITLVLNTMPALCVSNQFMIIYYKGMQTYAKYFNYSQLMLSLDSIPEKDSISLAFL